MILVDTNVWSELVRQRPDKRVVAWEQEHAEELWLSSVVVGEFLSGVEAMPQGTRKRLLGETYETILAIYADRLIGFDLPAARRYAAVLTFQEAAGRDPGTADTQIAATALAAGMALATRNTKHFAGLGLDLINPWEA
ncbi:PIN domain-containing protein [Sphingomonas qilianensis]|uniref:Ribonuclease VapC n=1 Tax=Sphingomonas qilianensis TaxID=1736690 RepID=A0ABU9XRY8_9SPHN